MSNMMRLVTLECDVTDPVNGADTIPAGTPVVVPHYAATHLAIQCRNANLPPPRVSRMGYYTRPLQCRALRHGESILAWRGAGIGDQLIVAGCLEQIRRLYPSSALGLMCDPNVARALYSGAENLPFRIVTEPVALIDWDSWEYHWIVEGYCDGNHEPDQPDVWYGHLQSIGLGSRVAPDLRRVFVPESARWTANARAFLQTVSDGLGSSLPRTPTGMVAPAGAAEYNRVAAAPVGRASTPRDLDAQWDAHPPLATAGTADAGAQQAQPASSPVSGGDRMDEGSGESATPRPPEASRPFILFQLAASTPMRSLPPALAAECLRQLVAACPESVIVLAGTDHEFEVYSEACGVAGVAGTTRGLKLQEVFALVKLADVVVAPDSCLGHVAARYETPCVSYWCPFPSRSRASTYGSHSIIEMQTDCSPCWAHEYGPVNLQRGCPLSETDATASRYCKGLAAIQPETIVNAVMKEIC